MNLLRSSCLALLILGTVAAPARADWWLTPFTGVVFGGAANQFSLNDLDDEFEQRFNVGGSFGWRSSHILGVELDVNFAPNFFQFTGGTNDFDLFDMNSSVRTITGNIVLQLPGDRFGSGFRPYVLAGLGSVRTQLRSESDVFDDITSDDTIYNFGGGFDMFPTEHVGLRIDARYFRGLESLDDEDPIDDSPFFDQAIATDVFSFWRGTVGLTFRW
jgi:opacity protein-like surface antigen